jgi:dipeptidase D
MTFVSELEPRALWSHFDRVLSLPRGSKRESRIREHVLDLARRRGLDAIVDGAGNVLVRKPAAPGREPAACTVIQSHLDMVQEKNADVVHDFDRDPIRPRRDGAFLKASGTTLGADNGIGVAAMLALLDSDAVAHGPLELLFTVDEETGLSGAAGLDGDLLRGRRLINCDSEEEGLITIGCAGGADTRLRLPTGEAPVAPGSRALTLSVSGLRGGHSGIDIHLERGNAAKIVLRALHAARERGRLRIASIAGGSAHNAIPREAAATIVTSGAALEPIERALRAELDLVASEIRLADPGFTATVARVEAPPSAFGEAETDAALRLAVALPHGVTAMSLAIAGLVETSTNFAVVRARDGALEMLMSSRSSIASALAALRRSIRAVGELGGAEVEEHEGYPGWTPNVASALLATVRAVHVDALGFPPRVGAVHAGLECGIIGEKVPGMDMVSIGPTIQFPHSPDERVEIETVGRFWRLLTVTLERLAA